MLSAACFRSSQEFFKKAAMPVINLQSLQGGVMAGPEKWKDAS